MQRYRARWLLPISRPPVEDGAVVVDGHGRIAYAGPRGDAPSAPEEDLGDVALLPGLVNAHTHLELTAMRGFLEDLSFWEWINTLTRARRAVLTGETLVDSARLGIAEGLRAGITTYADTSASGAPLAAMRELGVRGIMYQEVFGPDPAQCDESLAELRAKVDALRPQASPLVRIGVSPHAPYSVSDALFRATARLAIDERLPIAVHVAESAAEVEYVRDAAGPWAVSHRARGITVVPRATSPVRLLGQAAVLDARPLLIHCIQADDEDVSLAARHRCGIAHCPASNAKLGHGVAPLDALLRAGVAVGLGSDSVASNNRMDILEEARLAALVQRATLRRHDVVSATEALALATIGGARAIGLDAEVGTLDPGKQADLAAFSLEGVRETPSFDPAAALVFAVAGRPATFAAVAGRVLLRDGRLLADPAPHLERVRAAAASLAAWRRAAPTP